MKVGIITSLLLALLGSIGSLYAGDTSPKIEAVKQYLLKDDYPELFGDKPYRMRVNDIIEADVDGDGEDEVILHVTPHYLQSATIILFRVSKNLRVTRVTEGLAPGPLVPLTNDFIDSHTLGVGVDLTLGKDQSNPAKRREFSRLTLEEMGGVVEYRNFIHMDGRKGKGFYVDMTNLAKPPAKDTCEAFEFSMPEAVSVISKKDGSGNYLVAAVGKSIYVYKIHKIREDGFLEKTLTVMPVKE